MKFLSSDHHFCHTNIIKYCDRPFTSVEEMNEVMVERWNKVVKPEDEVYYLGDFSLAKSAVAVFGPKLNGTKYLIPGNHDACHPCHKNSDTKRKMYYDAGFKTIRLEDTIAIAGQKVIMSHMPYYPAVEPVGYDLRFKEFRPSNNGLWLLHGHVHEKWKTKEKMINVGVDVWNFYPVSIDEISTIITNDYKNQENS